LNIIKRYAPLKSLNIIYMNMIQLAHFSYDTPNSFRYYLNRFFHT